MTISRGGAFPTRRFYLRLADVSEHERAPIGLHLAQALPDDLRVNIVGRGISRAESLEQLVVEIDRLTASLYEARRLAIETLQDETA